MTPIQDHELLDTTAGLTDALAVANRPVLGSSPYLRLPNDNTFLTSIANCPLREFGHFHFCLSLLREW